MILTVFMSALLLATPAVTAQVVGVAPDPAGKPDAQAHLRIQALKEKLEKAKETFNQQVQQKHAFTRGIRKAERETQGDRQKGGGRRENGKKKQKAEVEIAATMKANDEEQQTAAVQIQAPRTRVRAPRQKEGGGEEQGGKKQMEKVEMDSPTTTKVNDNTQKTEMQNPTTTKANDEEQQNAAVPIQAPRTRVRAPRQKEGGGKEQGGKKQKEIVEMDSPTTTQTNDEEQKMEMDSPATPKANEEEQKKAAVQIQAPRTRVRAPRQKKGGGEEQGGKEQKVDMDSVATTKVNIEEQQKAVVPIQAPRTRVRAPRQKEGGGKEQGGRKQKEKVDIESLAMTKVNDEDQKIEMRSPATAEANNEEQNKAVAQIQAPSTGARSRRTRFKHRYPRTTV